MKKISIKKDDQVLPSSGVDTDQELSEIFYRRASLSKSSYSCENLSLEKSPQKTTVQTHKDFYVDAYTRLAIEDALYTENLHSAIIKLKNLDYEITCSKALSDLIITLVHNKFSIKRLGHFLFKLIRDKKLADCILSSAFEKTFHMIRIFRMYNTSYAFSEIISGLFDAKDPISLEFLKKVLNSECNKFQRADIITTTLNLAAKKIGYDEVRVQFVLSNLKIEDFLSKTLYVGGLSKYLKVYNIEWILIEKRKILSRAFLPRIDYVFDEYMFSTKYGFKKEFSPLELQSKVFIRTLIAKSIYDYIDFKCFDEENFQYSRAPVIKSLMENKDELKYEGLFALLNEDLSSYFLDNQLFKCVFWILTKGDIITMEVLCNFDTFMSKEREKISLSAIRKFLIYKNESFY
ncbi:unnamed protein product [Brachionus calyciflorus]|uniref:Uncharacterized protein n=1 Tax=Brachionus calyciflorus TaxID=104777 RepID=A0A814BA80_9BILA|nr:unnamed protein product [Brachionus calyciflorus]